MKDRTAGSPSLILVCLLGAMLACGFIAPAWGQQLQALDEMEAKARGDLRVRWDEETGSPALLSGRLGRPFVGSSAEAAIRFIADHRGVFFASPPAGDAISDPKRAPLRVSEVVRRGSVDHVRVLQFHGDLPVHRGGYTVSLRLRPGPGGTTAREPVSVIGKVFGDIGEGFDPHPAVAKEAAIVEAIREVAGGVEPTEPPLAELFIYPEQGIYHLAWRIEIHTDEPLHRWVVFLDARTGGILERQDIIMHGNVQGNVYLHNPVQGPALPENLPLRDAYVTVGSDVVVTDEAGNYDDQGAATVTTAFVGPYVDVNNEDFPDATYTGAPDVVWNFPTTDTAFDEVNTFYHINAFHGWVESFLGYQGANRQIPVVVHYGNSYNNAFYDGVILAFGDGDGFGTNSFASDDVIYHEYGHFLFDVAIQMGYGNNEVGGMNEGYADYFAGAFSEDPLMGEAVVVGGAIRDLDNKNATPPRIYPDYLVANGFEPHAGGEVWGGAVWDIRKVEGGLAIDPVAFEALFYLPPWQPLFIDGRAGMVEADIQLHHGIHKYTIELLMYERGIGPPPDTDPFVRVIPKPPAGVAPLPVVFEGIAVDDGTIVNYAWDLGDGTTIPDGGPTVSHVYGTDGTYTATLTVTDDTAATGSHSVQIDVAPPGSLAIRPEEMDIGFVRSDVSFGNFFGDDDVYAGGLAGMDHRGAALFRLPVIPGGTSDLVFDSATVEFTGQDDSTKGPTGGIWSVKLLREEIDTGWRSRGYDDIVAAPSLYTLDPPLGNGDLSPGGVNTFTVTSAQLPSLHDRVVAGSLSFRVDGPYGVNNLFSWDSGYDRFDEDPTATRIMPVLRLVYTQGRLPGDVNADGVVDATDNRWVAEATLGLRYLSEGDRAVGDVDRNGVLDERDAAAILAREAGLIDF